jgi:preprotein translocase subunit SecE
MNDVTPQSGVGGSADTAKLIAAIVLILAGIAGFYLLQAQSGWLGWAAVAVGVVLAVAMFGSSARGKLVWQFVQDSRQELRKVVWPTRQETTTTTMVVFAFTIIVGLFFWGLDMFLSWAIGFLTGRGG